jgi:hypothetical protein
MDKTGAAATVLFAKQNFCHQANTDAQTNASIAIGKTEQMKKNRTFIKVRFFFYNK